MRSFIRHGLILGSLATATVVSAGCEQKKATEYVTGVSTQVQVPRDLKAVRITLSTGGVPTFCQSYKVHNGKVLLPRTLGNFPSTEDALRSGRPITFSIVGLTEDLTDTPTNGVFQDCFSRATITNSQNVRILRRSTQPYVEERILFLPMPLKYSCYDKECPEELTCKGGTCVNPELTPEQAKALPDFTEDLGDGDGSACFNVGLCMGAVIPAITMNPETCEFAVAESADASTADGKKVALANNVVRPACTTADDCNLPGTPEQTKRLCGAANPADAARLGWTPAPGQCDLLPPIAPTWKGVNVEISYDGGHTVEYLDLDPNEGFTIPDPTKPQRFKLAPGLCEMWRGVDAEGKPTPHRISSIRASGTCTPKLATQPICKADALKLMGADADGDVTDVGICKVRKLEPVKSALAVVLDGSAAHNTFFNKDERAGDVTPIVKDPAFDKTQFALFIPPGGGVTPTCSAPIPFLAPQLSNANEDIRSKFLTPPPGQQATPAIEGALEGAYAFLKDPTKVPADVARRAVLVLGNQSLNASTCGDAKTPSQLAEEAKVGSPSVFTYALQVVNGDSSADAFVVTGSTGGYDASPDKAEDRKAAFQQVINRLASCYYEPTEADAPTEVDQLNFADPLTAKPEKIVFDPACNQPDGLGNGWGFDTSAPSPAGKKRVVVCGAPCKTYQDLQAKGSTFALLYKQPGLPVPMYVTPKACFSK